MNNIPDHPVIRRMERTGSPEAGQPPVFACEGCGEEFAEAQALRLFFGCALCGGCLAARLLKRFDPGQGIRYVSNDRIRRHLDGFVEKSNLEKAFYLDYWFSALGEEEKTALIKEAFERALEKPDRQWMKDSLRAFCLDDADDYAGFLEWESG